MRVALHIGRPLSLLPAEELPLHGALTRAIDGTLAARVPVRGAFREQPDTYLVHLACRGLARALLGVPGESPCGHRLPHRGRAARHHRRTRSLTPIRACAVSGTRWAGRARTRSRHHPWPTNRNRHRPAHER
ncbi:putative serine-threonine protein kinase [Streptomyces sp. Tu6071]|nr:putative serine-threonine protein kinase [Streptomyces sp. Tu6071]